MPKLFWVALAGTIAAKEYGVFGVLALVLAEMFGAYATGFYTAWRNDVNPKASQPDPRP